jgi:hypothetical protein
MKKYVTYIVRCTVQNFNSTIIKLQLFLPEVLRSDSSENVDKVDKIIASSSCHPSESGGNNAYSNNPDSLLSSGLLESGLKSGLLEL